MTTAEPESPRATTTIVVPASQPMVALLGSRDEYLRLVENAFPAVDILARGNEITVAGSPDDVALIDMLMADMLAMLRTGQALTVESVERSIALVRTGKHVASVSKLAVDFQKQAPSAALRP